MRNKTQPQYSKSILIILTFMLFFIGSFLISQVTSFADTETDGTQNQITQSETSNDNNLDLENINEVIYKAQSTMIDVKVSVDGTMLKTDVSPKVVVETNRTLIPVRALFEQVGGTVLWNANEQTVTIRYNNHNIILVIDSKNATVDNMVTVLDQPATILPGDRTFIPLRFVAESLGFTVEWNGDTQTAMLTSPKISKPQAEDDPQASIYNSINSVGVSYGTSVLNTTITINSDNPISDTSYKAFTLSSPDRYVIDFYNSDASSSAKGTFGKNTNGGYVITAVRTAMFDDSTFRVVCDLNEVSTPAISLSSDRKTMTITFGEVSKPYNPWDDNKLVVVLDPGHGESTAGKRSPDNGESLREYEFNRDVAYRTKAELEKRGITVYLTVSDDTSDPSLAARYDYANSTNADIYVSIHANAFSPDGVTWTDARGWEIYYYPTSYYGKKLATAIHDANAGKIGINDRGIKTAEYAVISHTTMPAVLIEHGFFTNLEEVELLASSEFRQKCAELNAQGIVNFFNSFKK